MEPSMIISIITVVCTVSGAFFVATSRKKDDAKDERAEGERWGKLEATLNLNQAMMDEKLTEIRKSIEDLSHQTSDRIGDLKQEIARIDQKSQESAKSLHERIDNHIESDHAKKG
jgi:signal transduction histidine kinase